MTEIVYIYQDQEDRRSARRLGDHLGHRVATVAAGEDLSQVSADLALIDIQRAGAGVFDALEDLREAGVPVVAWTSESRDRDVPIRHQALAVGCVGCVPKPATDDVAQEIEAYASGHRDEALSPESRAAAVQALGGSAVSRLVRANGRLQRLLTEREVWFHSVVHELRSALAWVAVYAAMLEDGREVPGPRSAWDHLRSGLAALRRRIADLEVFSQVENGGLPVELEVHGLSELARDYADRHRSACDECMLRTSLSPVKVAADRGRLMQVLDNLVDNAHKFTALVGRHPEIELRVGRENEWAVLEVVDNGPGIRPSHREGLFDPFARPGSPETRGVPGMGLGLSVVERIVRAHGGDVTCDDNGQGPGCCFRVRLPRHRGSPRVSKERDGGRSPDGKASEPTSRGA